MRYLRWIFVLLFLLFIIMEIAYNFSSTSQAFVFKIWVPGKTIATLNLEIWVAMLIMFGLGFGLAIIFEIYYWGKYKFNLRKQSKVIQDLKKKMIE